MEKGYVWLLRMTSEYHVARSEKYAFGAKLADDIASYMEFS